MMKTEQEEGSKAGGSLAIFSRAAVMLAEADTIQKAKELKSMAMTAADWARRKGMGEEAVKHAMSYARAAEVRMGEMLIETERANAARDRKKAELPDVIPPPTLADLGVSPRESADAQEVGRATKAEKEAFISGKVSRASVKRAVRKKRAVKKLMLISAQTVEKASGKYDVVVVDPPWPIEKIERDCRPNQNQVLDYPVMTLSEIGALDVPAAEDCHLWLWTTHRFLPAAFDVLSQWGFNYCCAFVWHKSGGFQPCELPQFNCEFALYARRGSPVFVTTKEFKLCFDAQRGAHSEKPDEFYDLVRRVTAGRRLDMFNRRKLGGFDGWGKESA